MDPTNTKKPKHDIGEQYLALLESKKAIMKAIELFEEEVLGDLQNNKLTETVTSAGTFCRKVHTVKKSPTVAMYLAAIDNVLVGNEYAHARNQIDSQVQQDIESLQEIADAEATEKFIFKKAPTEKKSGGQRKE